MLKNLTAAIRRRLLEDALVEYLLESRSGLTASAATPAPASPAPASLPSTGGLAAAR